MEFLETSRSARKMDPTRTSRYRRADPRSTNIVLGFDRNQWETTNKRLQNQVLKGSKQQGKFVQGERKMTSSRKRGMLESTLSLGNAINEWRTESTQHYHQHDLRSWGPRSMVQRDSYSWTDGDRRKLTTLRDASNSDVTPDMSHYTKLPPIYARPGSHVNGNHVNGYQSDFPTGAEEGARQRGRQSNGTQRGRQRQIVEEEEDI